MLVKISKITVAYPYQVMLQWDVEPDPQVSGDYYFEVERSGSPEGPWLKITNQLQNTIFYVDSYLEHADDSEAERAEAINLNSLNREVYYRIKATDPVGTIDYSQPINLDGVVSSSVEHRITGIGSKVVDDEQVDTSFPLGVAIRPRKHHQLRLLRRKILSDQYTTARFLNGISINILKRKHFGRHCTTCKDPNTLEVLFYKCTECFGTGWIGGFYTPIGTFGLIQPSPSNADVSEIGNTSTRITSIRLLSYPKVEVGDVIAEDSTARRWLISRVDPSEVHRLLVHQEIVASELSRDSIEYLVE